MTFSRLHDSIASLVQNYLFSLQGFSLDFLCTLKEGSERHNSASVMSVETKQVDPRCDERNPAALQRVCEPISPVFPSVGSNWSSQRTRECFRILKDFTFHRSEWIHVVVDPSPHFLYEAVGLFVLPDLRSVCPECWQHLSSVFRGADWLKHSLQCVTGGKESLFNQLCVSGKV